ncbi:MAG: biotin--[acetyl-CoA-carboxylase] ligase [Chitinophagaceae bacterium]
MISTGGHLTILESVDSTNNYAMAMVRAGQAKHGDGFFALEQVQGRGQRGKTWLTEPGTNIILTIVLQVQNPLSQQFSLSMAIALAVYDFFAKHAGDETSIKWPNDIYWRDRKAGGILIESIVRSQESGVESKSQVRGSELIVPHPTSVSKDKQALNANAETTDSDSINYEKKPVQQELQTPNSELKTERWFVVGMGININQTSFAENLRNVVSLKQITGKNWDVIELAKELCTHVENRYQQLASGKDLLSEYNAWLFKKGQTVKFKKDNRVFEAVVNGVDAFGKLRLMTAIEEQFGFGELEWVLG